MSLQRRLVVIGSIAVIGCIGCNNGGAVGDMDGGVMDGASIDQSSTADLMQAELVRVISDPVVVLDAMIGYTTKVQNIPVNLRLNIRNLANKHYLNGTFQYGEPRTFIASVGLKF